MKYCVFFFIGMLLAVMALVSCSSKQMVLTDGVVYAEEYQERIAIYQDTVNPQLYYNIDNNIHVIKKDNPLFTSQEAN